MTTASVTDPRILDGMRAQLALRARLLEAGGTRLGWKAGFGAPAILARLGLAGPLSGFLMRAGELRSGAEVGLGGWVKPILEPEIAVYFGRDLGPGASEETARAAIAGLGAAIELVDLTFPPEDVTQILSGNIFQRHVVLGPCDTTRAGARLDGMSGRVVRNGREVAATADLEANTGRILDTVRHIATTLARFGEGIEAGDVIIAGSVVPPLPIEAVDRTVSFRLDPVGEVSVAFAQ